MEALPNMPMMAPQFRTSTLSYDNIPNFDFRYRVKEFILLNFTEDPHEFDSSFDELSQLKFEANIPSASVEQICKLKRYYGQLCMMQKRFPMAPGEQLETPFAWNDGLVDMRSAHSEVTIMDIEFEKASVMFNIGACHAQYAAEQPRDTQDSIKAAFMHFQYAAYAFEQLNSYRNSEMFYPSVDLDTNVVLFYYKVLIAQAQECLVQKSLLDNRSAIVIAKLSLWLQEAYDSAAKVVDEWTVNIPESVQKYYTKLCRLKSDMYGVIAYMSLGDHAETEEKKMGWRLQYYNIAAKFMEEVQLGDRKMKERYPEMLVTASFLYDVINAKQKNADKENNFIYHDRVPKEEEAIDAAKKDGAMCKVKTLSFDPLDASVCGDDIFGRLLPQEIIESTKKYEAEKAEILKKNKEVIQSFDAHLDAMLERCEFDKLRYMLNEGKNTEALFEIPDELMKRNADMTAYPDCVPNLIERLRESSDTARVAEAKLNTLIAKLSAVDLPRLKADEGFVLISKELEKLAEHLSQAKANNVSLNKAIASHSANLQLLSLPCNEMWQKIIPEWNAPKEMSPEEANLRRMVDKVLEMRTQRHALLTQIEGTIKQDDISKKLMGTNEERSNLIIHEELSKYGRYEQLIKLNVAAQETIVRAFADANADFCAERIVMQKAKGEYDQKVADLVTSYDVYRDVVKKTEEGEQFYRQLMARCDQFAIPVHAMEEQYRAEAEKKERAQKEAEQHMQQIRMNREAQSALMDFGGGGASMPSMGPPRNLGPMGPPPGSSNRAPRLGDYLDSYRARKQNPSASSQFQPQEEPQGPPSPTPSSVCDYPVSSRQQRMMASPRLPPMQQQQPSPNSGQFYGPPGGPGGPGGYQPPPQQQFHASNPIPQFQPPAQPSLNQYQPPAPSHQYQPPPVQYQPPVSHYQPPVASVVPPAASQYQPPPPQQPSYLPPQPAQATQVFQHSPQGAPISAPPPTSQLHQHVPPQQQYQQNYQNYQQPPQQEYGAPGAGQPFGGQPGYGVPTSVAPQNYGPPPVQPAHGQGYEGVHAPAPVPQNPYGGLGSTQNMQTVHGGPPTAQMSSQNAPGVHGGPQNYRAPLATQNNAPVPVQQQPQQGFGAPVGYRPPSNGPTSGGFGAQPTPQQQGFGQPGGQFNFPGAPQRFGAQPPAQQNVPSHAPPTPQPLSNTSSQSSFQGGQTFGAHPPVSTAPPTTSQPVQPTPAPPPSSQSNFPGAQGFSAPPPAPSVAPSQPPTARFTPTAATPSPWHATPAELKTPWNATPQYHAPAPAQSSGPSPIPSAVPTSTSSQNPSVPSRSNVDLLSDLLGDFNLPPPIQPSVQNSQNLQAVSRPDFRPAPVHPDPGKPPVAFVPPMPQQPQQPQQQQQFHPPLETPILVKNVPSVTELVDPSKFQLGEGNAQKLEKRMLHHSIRTNGPPPPLNQSDPLNQIDAFSFAPIRR